MNHFRAASKAAYAFSAALREEGMGELPTIKEYGCVECQLYHAEGDPLYAQHLFRQSKHGTRCVPGLEMILRRLLP
jgi:hypothetical protein